MTLQHPSQDNGATHIQTAHAQIFAQIIVIIQSKCTLNTKYKYILNTKYTGKSTYLRGCTEYSLVIRPYTQSD